MDSEFLIYIFISLVFITRAFMWIVAVRNKGFRHAGMVVTDTFILITAFWIVETLYLFDWSVAPYDLATFFVILIVIGTRNILVLIRRIQKTQSLKGSFDQWLTISLCLAGTLIIWFGLI